MTRIVVGDNERVCKWMLERGAGSPNQTAQCLGLEKDGELTAGVQYESWNGASIWMHVAGDGKNWLTREFLRACFDYPFRQLKAKVVVGLVPAVNKQAQRFDEHLGFKLHSTLPDGHKEGDLLIYTMRPDDCRWLRRL